MKAATLLPLALMAAPHAAQEGPQPALAEGERVEAEVRADLDGDALPDLAYIARSEEQRELRVVTTHGSASAVGETMPQVLALDPYPLGDGSLMVRNRVLLLEDLTGGTTAVASTHRFRWDAKLGAMRLIGLDATLYSRTFAHDGSEASWNLLTGDLVTQRMRLRRGGGDQAYDIVGRTRRKKPSPPIRLEDAPAGDDLLGWPGGQ